MLVDLGIVGVVVFAQLGNNGAIGESDEFGIDFVNAGPCRQCQRVDLRGVVEAGGGQLTSRPCRMSASPSGEEDVDADSLFAEAGSFGSHVCG